MSSGDKKGNIEKNDKKNDTKENKVTKSDHLELETCPFDPRFPHMNQTKHCFMSFVDFHKCSRLLEGHKGCEQLQRCYKSLCPNDWITQWEEQIEEGSFPVKLPPIKKTEEKKEEVDKKNKKG